MPPSPTSSVVHRIPMALLMKALIVLVILCSSQAGYWSGVGWNWSLLHVYHKLAAGSFVLPAAHGVPLASSASSHESCQGLMLSNSSYWSLLVSYKQAFGDSRKVKQLLTGSNLWWTRLRYGQQLAGISGGRQGHVWTGILIMQNGR